MHRPAAAGSGAADHALRCGTHCFPGPHAKASNQVFSYWRPCVAVYADGAVRQLYSHVLMRLRQVLLAKYGGQEDVVVGTPYANRDPSEVENLLGAFVKCALNPSSILCCASCSKTFASQLIRHRADLENNAMTRACCEPVHLDCCLQHVGAAAGPFGQADLQSGSSAGAPDNCCGLCARCCAILKGRRSP